jgi:DNA-binding transcriptional regulator YhcF (GntR family)
MAHYPSFDVALDKHSAIPLYLQLRHHIVYLIGSGELEPGTTLPSVRQLAAQLDLAPATVQRTYGELQAQGFLVAQPGRGIHVPDLTADLPNLAEESSDVLRTALERALTHVRGLGFTDREILSTVGDLVFGGRLAAGKPRVVFVAVTHEFAETYRGLLRDELAGLNCTVDTLTLDELATNPDLVLDRLEPVRCLVSVVGTFSEMRRLVGHREILLFPLVVDLTEETQQAFVHLPTDVPIGLIAEKHLIPTRRALLSHYRGTDDGLMTADVHNRSAVRRVLLACRFVVHSVGSRQLLAKLAAPSVELIEMKYRPNATSLARLRALLAPRSASEPAPRKTSSLP